MPATPLGRYQYKIESSARLLAEKLERLRWIQTSKGTTTQELVDATDDLMIEVRKLFGIHIRAITEVLEEKNQDEVPIATERTSRIIESLAILSETLLLESTYPTNRQKVREKAKSILKVLKASYALAKKSKKLSQNSLKSKLQKERKGQ